MRFVELPVGHRFVISSDGGMPALLFATDGQGAHSWEWTIHWRGFRKTGRLTTPSNTVDLAAALAELGGRLTLTTRAGKQIAFVTVTVVGTNPSQAEVRAYLATKTGGPDFTPIVLHEAHGRHFTAKGEPIVSFDGGYGMVQLTDPIPTYRQV